MYGWTRVGGGEGGVTRKLHYTIQTIAGHGAAGKLTLLFLRVASGLGEYLSAAQKLYHAYTSSYKPCGHVNATPPPPPPVFPPTIY